MNLLRWEANDVNPVLVKFELLNKFNYSYISNLNEKSLIIWKLLNAIH